MKIATVLQTALLCEHKLCSSLDQDPLKDPFMAVLHWQWPFMASETSWPFQIEWKMALHPLKVFRWMCSLCFADDTKKTTLCCLRVSCWCFACSPREAWKALGDTSPHQAMQEYVATVKKLDPSWNPQVGNMKIFFRKQATVCLCKANNGSALHRF